MTFTQSISTCFNKYAVFTGRASLSEFWWWIVFTLILSVACNIPLTTLGYDSGGVLAGLVALTIFLPGLGVSIRRLHDTGRSGWWILLNFIPIVGSIVLLIFFVQPSTPPNKYGDVPE